MPEVKTKSETSKTLLRKAEQALETAIEENKRIRLSYTQRMGELAHEMKNSLNAMMGFSEILKEESFGAHTDPRYQEYAAFVHESARHMLSICNRELEESKSQAFLENITRPVRKSNVVVNELIDHTMTALQGLADERGVALNIEIDDDFPVLHTDPVRLQQILHNLVSNAVKFTPKEGNVTIKAKTDKKSGAYILVIKDNGIGVPAEDVLKVMEPFKQIEEMEQHGDAGSGLGLAIVKRLVHEIDAELEFKSRKNVGTTVSVIFKET